MTALAAVVGVAAAVTLRRWDAAAGLSVAELKRAKASAEWQHEERVAELEADLEEGRELRIKLEQRLRSKRAELAALRNEHASLLRRYATAETERASALEGRRLLEIEAKDPVPALPPVREAPALGPAPAPEPARPFSPRGGELFRRARAALDALETRPAAVGAEPWPAGAGSADSGSAFGASGIGGSESDGSAFGEARSARAELTEDGDLDGAAESGEAPEIEEPARVEDVEDVHGPDAHRDPGLDGGRAADGTVPATDVEEALPDRAVPGDGNGNGSGAEGEPGGATGGSSTAQPVRPAGGHYTVPTAVAVVPAAGTPRRPGAEGGFDFFGTQRAEQHGSEPQEAGQYAAREPAVQQQEAQQQEAPQHETQQQAAPQQAAQQTPWQPAAPQPRSEGRTASVPAQPLIRTSPRTDVGRVIDVDAQDDDLHAAS
ncbi:hypothetical protein [Streptomyces abyssomicinicus]|uniref:hypothetical protein n=1 Tax=Streptomyces abyssomicinicus TaxID=574929 RepID=UPI0012505513|nr:hypothetical protein [Streptomyces abyssomicinicus]